MRPVLYYVHHHGLGHWRRALAVATQLDRPVIFASSTPPPQPLPNQGRFVHLPADFPAAPVGTSSGTGQDDPGLDAHGRLHWAPSDHVGLLQRHHLLLTEAVRHRPALAVVDVSMEITVLLRTCGIPTVAVRLPGERDDEAHRLGFDLADEVIMPVPELWRMHTGLARTRAVGLIGATVRPALPIPLPTGIRSRVLVVVGSGGCRLDREQCRRIAQDLPDHDVRVLGLNATSAESPVNLTFAGRVEDPRDELAAARVVIGNAGLGTVSDVVGARRPFVVVPEDRPFGEQQATGRALRAGRDAVVLSELPGRGGWRRAVHQAVAQGPALLTPDGAIHFADLIEQRIQARGTSLPALAASTAATTLPVVTLPSPSGPGRIR